MVKFRNKAVPEMKERFWGIIWSESGHFLDAFYGRRENNDLDSQIECFKALFEEIQRTIVI